MVPSEVIDEIRNRVDLVRLIGEVVPLKKTGRNFSGLCPFHQEKSPSFTVSDQKQLYHCFGCGEGGTVFTFFMKFHRLSFPETLERLAGIAGIDLSKYQREAGEIGARKEEKKRLLGLLAYARDKYHHAYMESDVAREARKYAASRGITPETAKRLRLGFAPDGWETLVKAMERDGRSLEDARLAGLAGKKQGGAGYYDTFRNRLLFPIQDASGETVGFGGRVLGDGSPKYLNSPQTPLFDKGKLLFGLYEAEDAVRREKKIIVVEGYLDQVTLFESGIQNVVATLGTALTDAHARVLKKYADEVIVLFDGDDAGRKASRRSMRPLLSEGLRARAALLPKGFDPDTFVQKQGKQALADLIDRAAPMLDFFIGEFYRDEHDVSRKAEAIEELSELIRATQSLYLKEAILDEAAKQTGLDKSVLRGEKKTQPAAPARKIAAPSASQDAILPEGMTLLRLAAEVPEARSRLAAEDVFAFFPSEAFAENARAWLEKIETLGGHETPASAYVDAWENQESRPMLAKAFIDTSLDYSGAWERILNDCLRKLRGREISRLTQEVAAAEGAGNLDRVRELSLRMQALKRRTA